MKLVYPLGLGAIALGVAAPFAGSPFRASQGRIDADALAREIARGSDHVGARQLAAWIRDRRSGLRVIDVRSPVEFAQGAIPTAENIPLERLVRTRFQPGQTLVLYSEEGAHGGQAWVLLRALGVSGALFVPGGLADWRDEVMNPALPADLSPEERAGIVELSHFFGGTPRIDSGAPGDAPSPRRRGC
jgi:rhodanese-related sulfurtransferase